MRRFAQFATIAQLATIVTAVGSSAALAQSAQTPATPPHQPMSQADKAFLAYAAEDNQAEIALCLLAEKRASSPALKAFARLMVDDHVEIESRLAAVASGENDSLPEGVGDDGKKTHDKLDPLKGAEFQDEFLKAQIKDHSGDLKRFGDEASSTKNQALRQFASETRPILEQHLALAKSVQDALGKQ